MRSAELGVQQGMPYPEDRPSLGSARGQPERETGRHRTVNSGRCDNLVDCSAVQPATEPIVHGGCAERHEAPLCRHSPCLAAKARDKRREFLARGRVPSPTFGGGCHVVRSRSCFVLI